MFLSVFNIIPRRKRNKIDLKLCMNETESIEFPEKIKIKRIFQPHSDKMLHEHKSFIQLILFIIFKRVYKKQKHVIGCNMLFLKY